MPQLTVGELKRLLSLPGVTDDYLVDGDRLSLEIKPPESQPWKYIMDISFRSDLVRVFNVDTKDLTDSRREEVKCLS